MDRVGVEPTTSAQQQLYKAVIAYLKEQLWKENLIVQITFAPLFFFFLSALCSTIPSSEVILRKS
jgi:hypothetical protein